MSNQTSLIKHSRIIEQTRNWISGVIIEHGICPFAKREFENNRIHFEIIKSDELEIQLEQLILHCEALDNDESRETTLLIFPKAFSDFEVYLDVLDLATELMNKQDYEGIYQLASFHPNYCFADTDINDASNYTNRSPYPMFHILREASIEKALDNFPNPENIPERNIELTRKFGLEHMKQLLNNCF